MWQILWTFIKRHAKAVGVSTATAAVGGVVKWWYGLRKQRADALIAERQLHALNTAEELERLGKVVRKWAETEKQRSGVAGLLAFHEEQIASALGAERKRYPDLIEHLEKTGHARKSRVNPDGTKYWHIS